jgi:hypothetical protein
MTRMPELAVADEVHKLMLDGRNPNGRISEGQ